MMSSAAASARRRVMRPPLDVGPQLSCLSRGADDRHVSEGTRVRRPSRVTRFQSGLSTGVNAGPNSCVRRMHPWPRCIIPAMSLKAAAVLAVALLAAPAVAQPFDLAQGG